MGAPGSGLVPEGADPFGSVGMGRPGNCGKGNGNGGSGEPFAGTGDVGAGGGIWAFGGGAGYPFG